jgi:hypothetical protein
MNQIITELAEKATNIEEHGWGASYENFDREMFAELIIRECANQVNHVYVQGGGTYGERILTHFDVSVTS